LGEDSEQLQTYLSLITIGLELSITWLQRYLKNKEYDYKVDIWSAGVILYELCVGIDPFNAKGEDAIKAKIKENKPDYEKIPKNFKELEEIIRKMLKKDPK
jgi:serine/threonine protein kinase